MRTSTLADDGALEETEGRIQENTLLGVEVGRRPYRQGIVHIVGVILDGNDLQFALFFVGQPSFPVDHPGEFAYRHAMNDGNGKLTDAGP